MWIWKWKWIPNLAKLSSCSFTAIQTQQNFNLSLSFKAQLVKMKTRSDSDNLLGLLTCKRNWNRKIKSGNFGLRLRHQKHHFLIQSLLHSVVFIWLSVRIHYPVIPEYGSKLSVSIWNTLVYRLDTHNSLGYITCVANNSSILQYHTNTYRAALEAKVGNPIHSTCMQNTRIPKNTHSADLTGPQRAIFKMATKSDRDEPATPTENVDKNSKESSDEGTKPSARRPIGQANHGRSFLRDILSETILGMRFILSLHSASAAFRCVCVSASCARYVHCVHCDCDVWGLSTSSLHTCTINAMAMHAARSITGPPPARARSRRPKAKRPTSWECPRGQAGEFFFPTTFLSMAQNVNLLTE